MTHIDYAINAWIVARVAQAVFKPYVGLETEGNQGNRSPIRIRSGLPDSIRSPWPGGGSTCVSGSLGCHNILGEQL
jgi:hypothetical protein